MPRILRGVPEHDMSRTLVGLLVFALLALPAGAQEAASLKAPAAPARVVGTKPPPAAMADLVLLIKGYRPGVSNQPRQCIWTKLL